MSEYMNVTDNSYGWVYLGHRPFVDENGQTFGARVWLKNAKQPPIEATYIGEDLSLIEKLVDYQPLFGSSWRVRWSNKRKKWYLFNETEVK